MAQAAAEPKKLIAFEVKKCFSAEVAFTAQIDCAEDAPASIKLGLAIKWAFRSGADLSGADLSRADLSEADLSVADLSRADLSGADLIDGGQRSDGYRFVGWIKDGVLQIRAGCRSLDISAAREHWKVTRGGTPLGAETMAILDHIEAVAIIRGLVAVEAPKSEAA